MLTASQEELQCDGLEQRIRGDVKLKTQLLVLQQRGVQVSKYACTCPGHFAWCG